MTRVLLHHLLTFLFASLTMWGIHLGGIYQFTGIVIIFIIHPSLDFITTSIFGEVNQLKKFPSDLSLFLWAPFQTFFLLGSLYYLSFESNLFFLFAGSVSIGLVTGGFGITISHELIHRSSSWQRGFGVYLLSQVCYSVFRIEHVHGHHRRVATPEDPASAPKGMNIYKFIPQAIIGVFHSAYKIENKRLRKTSGINKFLAHRFFHYALLSLLWISYSFLLFGTKGLFIFLIQSLVAIILLETIDYIEHYGLRRQLLPSGKYAPVNDSHSWDTNFHFTNTTLFNLGKHAHHHQNASVPYQKLSSSPGANNYPFGYSFAIILALVPPLWFKTVDPLIKE